MKKVILKIDGMSCSACSNRVEKYLNKQEGVNASVNLVMAQALIEYDENKVSLKDLDRFVEESGYKSLGVYDEKTQEKQDNSKIQLIVFGILILILMYVSMSHMVHLPVIPFLHMINYPINYGIALLLLTLPFVIFGFDIIKSGITKLFHGSPNMDSLVSIGVLASLIYSLFNLIMIIMGNNEFVEQLYFEGSAMIIYFIKLGRFIDKKSKEKTKEAIKELVQITPQSALIKTETGEKEVTIDTVNVDDVLICKPGMKVAVDGIITKGETHLNEAFITGESIPSKKSVNDNVIAGSINIDGYIEYKAKRIGPNSTISEIVRLVVEATNTKAPIQRLADIVAGYFVPSIMIIALLTLVVYLLIGKSFNESIISFVTVLVVACPCALGLATPLAVVVSEGKSAKEGILIKSSETLENAHKVDTIVFDKTGTLTYGNLRISKIFNYSNYHNDQLLNIVSAIENKSSHPIALAFKDYYDSNIVIRDFKNIAGFGLKATIDNKEIYLGNSKLFNELNIKNDHKQDEETLLNEGNSIIYVVEDNLIIGLIGVKDIIRDNALKTVEALKHMHKEIIMLSGDNEKTAKIVASQIGIEKVIANVLPSQKEKVLKELMKNGHNVMMVGDGINDAPSLASANIGVSINEGTDIAADSADVILMQDDLLKIVSLLNISKKTISIIKQNLFWAFIYNILMIPLAMGLFKSFGISISPMFASMAMTISSLTVVLNSLRLRK
ncbi:MAG: heavy metal translocating P-type ATPase [Erysipelotrichaceae bacterium]|nr:heavy metal translocating P-type ATPase [Erysipelotrichaceae bacterium]